MVGEVGARDGEAMGDWGGRGRLGWGSCGGGEAEASEEGAQSSVEGGGLVEEGGDGQVGEEGGEFGGDGGRCFGQGFEEPAGVAGEADGSGAFGWGVCGFGGVGATAQTRVIRALMRRSSGLRVGGGRTNK